MPIIDRVLPAGRRSTGWCIFLLSLIGLLATRVAVANPDCRHGLAALARQTGAPATQPAAQPAARIQRLFVPSTPAATLRAELKAIANDDAERAKLAKWSLDTMHAREHEIRQPANLAKKKVLVIGAGIHSTIFLSNLVARSPEIAEQVLVLEASDVVTANYGLQQPFRINSGKPEFVDRGAQPNLFPGAVMTPEDADYQRRGDYYPNPNLFAETATIALRAQNVDVLFHRPVVGIREVEVGGNRRYVVRTANGETYQADTIVMATGVSRVKPSIPGLAEAMRDEKAKTAGDRNDNRYVPRVEVYTDLLARLGQEGPRDFAVYEGKTIGVIGAQHGGNITVETFLGKEPELVQRGFPDAKVGRIVWWNQKATNSQEFVAEQKPGGADAPKPLFGKRYSLYGLPEAFDSGLIEPIAQKTTAVEPLPNGQTRVHWIDEQGQPRFKDVDYLFVAAGFESPALPLLRESFRLGADGKIDLRPVVGGSRFYNGRPQNIFLIGPGSGVKVDPMLLARTVTGSPESINALGGYTAAFGRWLRQRIAPVVPAQIPLPPPQAFGT